MGEESTWSPVRTGRDSSLGASGMMKITSQITGSKDLAMGSPGGAGSNEQLTFTLYFSGFNVKTLRKKALLLCECQCHLSFHILSSFSLCGPGPQIHRKQAALLSWPGSL